MSVTSRIHDWFFNSKHEKCQVEIEDLKKTIARFTEENIELLASRTESEKTKAAAIDMYMKANAQVQRLLQENLLYMNAFNKTVAQPSSELEAVLNDLLAKSNAA